MRRSVELWLALATVVLITAGYAWVNRAGIPGPASVMGHSIGIVGFALMLATQSLHSLRKRVVTSRWGPTRGWLQLHVFTGIVGPYMVLLHTGWQNAGLAGVITWLTAVMVASGFVGRYVFTFVPPAAGNVEPGAGQGGGALAATRRLGALWYMLHVPMGLALFALASIHIVAAIYYATLLR